MPKGIEKMRLLVRNNATRQAEVGPNMMEEEVCCLMCRISLMLGNKESHLINFTHDHPNRIIFV